jgi:serine/threonine protein kinase/tetratricopeptide (TPR) repeat protein
MNAEEIFFGAVARPPAERAAFIAAACAGDEPLQRRIESLLHAYENPASFLSTSPFITAPTEDEPGSERLGAVIGPYKLIEELGEGGMGTVYKAQQTEPVQRLVALKVIKPGMDSKQVLARFEAERQALALMDHANIAKVLDAGATPGGLPYFVMELVKGVPITDYCDKNRLGLEQRLKLFIDVCRAIQHAHHKAIIHRDIKPFNVLVTLHDGEAVVKVIDFGIAKAMAQRLTDKTVFTSVGQMIGTPAYMSPEQAETSRLDIDTRSDVYSLGVLLYELLTGTTPIETSRLREANYAEIQRLICEEPAPWPNNRLSALGDTATEFAARRGLDVKRLSKILAGDPGQIVMKALDKDRSRRYDTPGNLIEDIERYLHHEPILARPPSPAYKLKKFLQRNRATVSMVAGMLAALLIGSGVAIWQAVHATRAAASEKKSKEVAQKREAETEATLDFVINFVFAAARPQGTDGGLGHDVTLRKAVEAAVPYVATKFADQPLVEARLRQALGMSFSFLGDYRQAAQQDQRARELYIQHLGPYHEYTLIAANNLASAYEYLGRYSDAMRLRQETLALEKASLGPKHRLTMGGMHNLALSYGMLGRYDEARQLHEETLQLRRSNLGPNDPDTFHSMMGLAMALDKLGQHEESLKLHQDTLALRQAYLGPDHRDTLRSMAQVGRSYAALGRHDDAVMHLKEVLSLQQTKLGANHPDTLWTMDFLAKSYLQLNRRNDSIKLEEDTLELRKLNLGPEHPDTLWSMNGLASCYLLVGRNEAALKLYEKALDLHKAQPEPDYVGTLKVMHNLAVLYSAVNREEDALKLREDTLAMRKTKFGADHLDTLLEMWAVADSLYKLHRTEKAVPIIDECIRLSSGKKVNPRLIPGVFAIRIEHFRMLKDSAGCRQTAEMWEKLNRTDADSSQRAAYWRAMTAAIIPKDPNITEADSSRLAKEEADQAMAWLKLAVANGLKDTSMIKGSDIFDVLRDREDFKKLLAEIKN